jgi:leucyl-tRNA synthetase
MKDQFAPLGLSFDWSKEVTTCEPDYYEQQQRIFLAMLENDLVYRRSAKVNWDPVENTVLANEQVVDGRGWRSGAVVEQRELEQWFFRITKYGDDLLAALDTLAGQGPHHAGQLDRQEPGREDLVGDRQRA